MASYLSLITKKLAGEITPEEEKSLQAWLDASPDHRRQYQQIENAWNSAYRPSVRGQERAFEKIAARIQPDQAEWVSRKRQPANFWNSRWKMAAALLLLLGASIIFIIFSENSTPQPLPKTTVAAIVTKSNPRGQKSIITLPDGSEVRLNAESYLEYPQDFSRNRQVKLVGEAFFDVVRDTLHPFTVTAGEVKVRVLGTSFNVQAFPLEEDLTVAVASGLVLVEKEQGKQSQTSRLRPQEMVKINHRTGAFEKDNFDPNELLAWKDGVLVFHQASFEQIVYRLERWYGVDFVIRRQRPITDGFTGRYNNPSLELVLEGMSFSSDFTFSIEGNQVIIE